MPELLGPVDWDEWKRRAEQIPITPNPTGLLHGVALPGMTPRQVSETERVALMVLSLGRHTGKKEAKIVRMALREIEQAVLQCEQEIEYESD